MVPFSGDEQVQQDPLDSLAVDFAAFFMEEHLKWLPYAKSRLGSKHDAEDAVQNAGATLYEKWGVALAGKDIQAVRAFAWKIVRDAVADMHRVRGRLEAKTRKLAQQGVVEETGQEEMDRLADRDAFRWAMDELAKVSPVQAEVVRLRQLREDYSQIGLVLDIAPSTAKTYASLGWRHLQHLLDPRNDQQEGN